MTQKSKREAVQLASPSGIQVGPSQYTHGQNNRPTGRQFTSRSRAKSTASFKGLRKVLTHDGSSLDRDGMKPTKSSDALVRKRTISGLNMTALARVRSNPNVHGGMGSHGHGHGGMWMGIPGYKPRKTRSPHAGSSAPNPSDSGGTTSDDFEDEEEVQTDEEEESGARGASPSHKMSGERLVSIDSIIEETNMDNGAEELVAGTDHVVKPLSYKVPSNFIEEGNTSISEDKLGDVAVPQETGEGFEDKRADDSAPVEPPQMPELSLVPSTNDKGAEHGEDELKKNAELSISNDHIGPGTTSDSNDGYDLYGNQLTRQINNKEQHETVPGRPIDHGDSEQVPQNSLQNQYIPNMILSQSTGVVRQFDEPPSIQNSLKNDISGANDNTAFNNKHTVAQQKSFHGAQYFPDRDTKPVLEQVPKHLAADIQELNTRTESDVIDNPDASKQQNKVSNFSNSYSSLTNNLQRANAAAVLGQAASARVPQSPLRTNTAGSSNVGATPLSSLFRKKSQQDFMLSSSGESRGDSTKGAAAKGEGKINNFSQFLKSDNSEGDSRTQRKLWLQRENSIMDLNVQNGSANSLFMVTNVDVKREFERITHEYTNARRYNNPLDASLHRLQARNELNNNMKKNTNAASKPKTKNGNGLLGRSIESNTEFFSNYGSNQPANINMEEFLPSAQNSKLQRVLSSIWKNESRTFDNEVNPLNRNGKNKNREMNDSAQSRLAHTAQGSRLMHSGSYMNSINQNPHGRNSLRNTLGNNPNSSSQSRMVNNMQPTTRAVNRRIESVNQAGQRF